MPYLLRRIGGFLLEHLKQPGSAYSSVCIDVHHVLSELMRNVDSYTEARLRVKTGQGGEGGG